MLGVVAADAAGLFKPLNSDEGAAGALAAGAAALAAGATEPNRPGLVGAAGVPAFNPANRLGVAELVVELVAGAGVGTLALALGAVVEEFCCPKLKVGFAPPKVAAGAAGALPPVVAGLGALRLAKRFAAGAEAVVAGRVNMLGALVVVVVVGPAPNSPPGCGVEGLELESAGFAPNSPPAEG